MMENEEVKQPLGHHQVYQHTHYGHPRRRRKRERIYEEVMAQNFTHFMKEMDLYIQEA